MGLLYGYLISWVLGGVLLTGDLLLRDRRRPGFAHTPVDASVPEGAGGAVTRAEKPGPWAARLWALLGMAATAMGGTGLALEATGALDGAKRPLASVAAGLVCAALGLSLTRARPPSNGLELP